uniref:Uncharacterized protein n=1 Tax=Arundo donax TaxID=35708 RepID=A0A0A9DJN9_ARUDO
MTDLPFDIEITMACQGLPKQTAFFIQYILRLEQALLLVPLYP